jgi:hypothetical protein
MNPLWWILIVVIVAAVFLWMIISYCVGESEKEYRKD